MNVRYVSGTMWNQLFLNKKKSQCEWFRRCLLVCVYWVSAPLRLLHSRSVWGSSSCDGFGSAGFVQSCSTPSGRTLTWSYISAKPTRQEETSDDWKSFSALALLCIALPFFFLSVCCVFAVEGTHGFVCMFDGGRGRWVVSSHNMCYLMCASASLAQAVCIWPFRCMKPCVWFVKVSGNGVPKVVLKKWCVVCK